MARNVISHRLEDDVRAAEAKVYETGKTVRDLVEARRRELERAEDAAETAVLVYIVLAVLLGLCAFWADLSPTRIIEIEVAVAACAVGVWFLIRRER
jgi:positive regulator of sigma E activity